MTSEKANQVFTSISLRLSREEAKQAGVKLPKLTTWKLRSFRNQYEVWANGDIVWAGNAYNAAEAKSNAIDRLISRHQAASATKG